MKKLFGLFLAAALLSSLWIVPAQAATGADKIDFNKFTCKQFLDLDGDDAAYFYFWLDGFVSAKTNNLVMSLDEKSIENDLQQLMKMCNDNKDSRLLTVMGY